MCVRVLGFHLFDQAAATRDAVPAQPTHCSLVIPTNEPTGHAVSAQACACTRDGRFTSCHQGKKQYSKCIVRSRIASARNASRRAGSIASFICLISNTLWYRAINKQLN